MLDQPDRPLHDRRRAAVVDLEVDPDEAGQDRVQAQHPADVGQPPAVDRLVVVADEQDPVRRLGEEQGEPELRPVDVLDLVDEEVGASASPAREQVRVGLEPLDRPEDEVVEVEPARGRDARVS